ncbi:MAG: toxin-antitoxin system YwqK family antitoxin, partial [Bacteroidia bacterium]
VTMDSAPKSAAPEKLVVETDSGRIEYTMQNGQRDGWAVQYSKDGKIKTVAMYDNDAQSGVLKRYDDQGNLIEAKHYSNGKELFDLELADFDFAAFEDTAIGLSIMIPKTWTTLPSPNRKLMASFQKPIDSTQVALRPNINIVTAKLKKGETVDVLANMSFEMMEKELGPVNKIYEERFRQDGCEAFKRYGMYKTEACLVGFLDAIIVSGDDVWFISCAAQNGENSEFLKYQAVFDEIISSFKRTKR